MNLFECITIFASNCFQIHEGSDDQQHQPRARLQVLSSPGRVRGRGTQPQQLVLLPLRPPLRPPWSLQRLPLPVR